MLADFLLMEQLFLGFRSLGVTWIKPRLVAGFFVYRHLGLVGCNTVLMKLLLSLLIFSTLHSQDLIGTWILKAHYNNYRLFTRHSKDSKIGSACIKWSFEYALARGGENILHKIKGLI
jgi:hypothetical protein